MDELYYSIHKDEILIVETFDIALGQINKYCYFLGNIECENQGGK